MRNRRFNCKPQRTKITTFVPLEIESYSHHAAANVHTYGSRNNCILCWENRSNRCTHTPMAVWHRSQPLENKRKLGSILQLLNCLVLEWNALLPSLYDLPITCINNFIGTHYFSLNSSFSAFTLSTSARREESSDSNCSISFNDGSTSCFVIPPSLRPRGGLQPQHSRNALCQFPYPGYFPPQNAFPRS